MKTKTSMETSVKTLAKTSAKTKMKTSTQWLAKKWTRSLKKRKKSTGCLFIYVFLISCFDLLKQLA